MKPNLGPKRHAPPVTDQEKIDTRAHAFPSHNRVETKNDDDPCHLASRINAAAPTVELERLDLRMVRQVRQEVVDVIHLDLTLIVVKTAFGIINQGVALDPKTSRVPPTPRSPD